MSERNSNCFSLCLKRFILCFSILSETPFWNTPQLIFVTYWGERTLLVTLRHTQKKINKKPLYPPLKGRVLIRDVNVFVFFTFLVLNKSLTKGSNSLVYDVDRVLLRSSVLFRNNKQCFLLQRDEIWDKKEEANSESPHSNGAFRSNHILSHSSCIWLVEKGYPSPTPRHENTVEHTG